MAKVERNLIEPIGEVNFSGSKVDLFSGLKKISAKLETFL